MRKMGLMPIYQRPRTSTPAPGHKIYPYLLRDLVIDRPNQVWCTDITYIPLARGFLYLVAIMDWWSRKVLAWRLSNTMEAAFCVDALEEALARHGKPEIFKSDQGSPFTSFDLTPKLKAAGIRISMDGKGRWPDNAFVERLWRSLKYECVYLHAWTGGREARDRIGSWMTLYNQQPPHAAHDGQDLHQDNVSASRNPLCAVQRMPDHMIFLYPLRWWSYCVRSNLAKIVPCCLDLVLAHSLVGHDASVV